MGNFVTEKVDGEIVEAIDFMVERVGVCENVLHSVDICTYVQYVRLESYA